MEGRSRYKLLCPVAADRLVGAQRLAAPKKSEAYLRVTSTRIGLEIGDCMPESNGEPFTELPSAPRATIAGRPSMPMPVRRSVILWSASAALWLTGAVLGAVLNSPFAPRGYSSYTTSSAPDPRTGVVYSQTHVSPMPVGLLVIFSMLLVAVWAGLILLLGRGRNWARVILTVLAVFGEWDLTVQLISAFGSPAAAAPVKLLAGLPSMAALVLVVPSIVLMYRPAAAPYFRRRPA